MEFFVSHLAANFGCTKNNDKWTIAPSLAEVFYCFAGIQQTFLPYLVEIIQHGDNPWICIIDMLKKC